MKIFTKILSLGLLSLSIFLQVGIAENVHSLALETEKMLNQFENNKDPDCLIKAIASTDKQKTSGIEEMVAIRIVMLKRLAPYYDPIYDISPPPPVQSYVMPPLGYDTGVSPEMISDANLRDDYIRRIEENKANAQQHKTQIAIRQLMAKIVALSTYGDLEWVEHQFEQSEMSKEMLHTMRKLICETKKNETVDSTSSYLREE